MKIVQLIIDNREAFHEYEKETPWFGTAPEALLQGFASMPELEVHVVACTKRAMKSPSRLADNIYFHSLLVPQIGWLRTGYQGCVRATRRKVREIGPDIVHGQGTERDCCLSAVFTGYPNVLTIHGNMAALARQYQAGFGSFHWLAGKLEDFTLPRADGVFCNSAYTEAQVRPRARKTWRVSNPLRSAFFASPPERAPGKRPRLINVGVISPRKRQLELLEMCARLHQRGLNFAVEFVGDVDANGSYGKQFLHAIQPATEQGYAFYSEYKEVGPLLAMLDQADGCIHFPTEEAFGLIVAEALARNLKFFGSRVGGIVDITASVESAELFAVEDWASLEQALARWFGEGYSRPTKAAQVMAERYHPRVIAERHVEIYREVLSSPRGRK